jgi:hypothetical protein
MYKKINLIRIQCIINFNNQLRIDLLKNKYILEIYIKKYYKEKKLLIHFFYAFIFLIDVMRKNFKKK